MKDISIQKAERKRDWALTESAFRQLLLWLDEGTDSGGKKYLEIRRRLVSYFDRKNCPAPDELADETLNRVARRLQEEGSITDTTPAHYSYIVAKFVFLEYLRRTDRDPVSVDELQASTATALDPAAIAKRLDETEMEERRLDCLEHCLKQMEPENRELIVRYYQGEQRDRIENRRALAEALSITMNALSIRACRLRDRLETCVSECLNR